MAAKVYLRKKISSRIASEHPWVFGNEIGDVEGESDNCIVSVFSSNGSFVGKGYYNPQSKISIRFLTRNYEEEIDGDFFLNKIQEAVHLRQELKLSFSLIRIVAGEADGLPGLIVDKIGDYLVFQIFTKGMEVWKTEIANALHHLFPNLNIYEKNSGHFRGAENLEDINKAWFAEFDETFDLEHDGVKIQIDLENGARTGVYWEQFAIAKFIQPIVQGKKILDAFCYQGYTLLHTLKHGADYGLGLDWSEEFILKAQENKVLNSIGGALEFQQANSFKGLKKYNKTPFDIIILDAPSLTGLGRDMEKILAGHERLLNGALEILAEEGYILITMSGRQIDENLIWEKWHQIFSEQRKDWKLVANLSQSPDHPVLWNVIETRYFRAWLIKISHQS